MQSRGGSTLCGTMRNFQHGDPVSYRGYTHHVCGFSPMSVRPRRLLLHDPVSRQVLEVTEDELQADQGETNEPAPEP